MTSPGSPIPDDDNVARWCRLGLHVDRKSGDLKNETFYLRSNEAYLSANWIEFHSQNHETAVNEIRDTLKAFPITINRGDKFIVLNVDELIDSIIEGGGKSPSVTFCPVCRNPSHVAIAWEDMAQSQQMVASELLSLILSQPEDVYPGEIS